MIGIDPRGIDHFIDWADYMYPDLQQFGVVTQMMPGANWQDWAAGLQALNKIAEIGAPNPYQFDDWKLWAMRFIQTLNSGGSGS
jgi:hypothetical protein